MKSELTKIRVISLDEAEATYLHWLTKSPPIIEGETAEESTRVEPKSERTIRENLYLNTL